MTTSRYRVVRIVFALINFALVLVFAPTLFSQQTETNPPLAGVPDDWTHHHVVFSDPGSSSQAAVRGKLEEWLAITRSPRFRIQQAHSDMMRRGAPAPALDFATFAAMLSRESQEPEPTTRKRPFNNGKWTMLMGGLASITGTFSGTPATSTTLTIKGASDTLVLTATIATSSSSCAYSSGTASVHFQNNASYLTNLIALINLSSCGPALGVTASSAGTNEVQITALAAGTAGNSISVKTSASTFGIAAWDTTTDLAGGQSPAYTPDIFPAKYSFSTGNAAGNCDSASTPDYVVYPTGLTGSSTQPNIIAYDNIYSSCPTTSFPIPNVYWQFNTGGLVTTSPVLSLDGSQVAFVQLSGGTAQLVMLKWNKDSALQSPTEAASGTAYNSCAGPCYYTITFSATAKFDGGTGGTSTPTTPTDTYSSPYYDYTNDAIYVGEDNGYLHKFSPVFNGSPAEVTTNWPVQVAVAPLNSPVEDEANGLVFEGGAVFASDSSAYYHSIPLAGGTATAYKTPLAETGTDGNPMMFDGAVLDSTSKTLYVSVNDDGGSTPSAAVWQLNEAFTSAVEGKIGQGANAAGDAVYSGTFDNIYETGSTGNFYVCGRASGSQDPELWRVNINGTTLTPTAIDVLTTGSTQCSPVTEFENGSTDYIFLSVTGSSNTSSPVSCPSNSTGCLMSFNVSTALAAGAATASKTSIAGGTSGIVIDNQFTTGGNSQIYFFPLAAVACVGNGDSVGAGTGPCAYQLSQSGLN
jgi:hypothetical protein